MSNIAQGVVMLHNSGLVRKDLKASNVLTRYEDSGHCHHYPAYLVDFESTEGVCRYRLLESFRGFANTQESQFELETFTQQSGNYDIVLNGERHTIPDETFLEFKSLVRKSWHEDPGQRP